MEKSIHDILPEAETLLALEPEEIGGIVLEYLSELPQGHGQLHRGNFTMIQTVQQYPAEYHNRLLEALMTARILHVAVQPLGVREPDDFDLAFSAMTRERPDALFLVTDALTTLNRKRVLDFAAVHRIPAMYEFGFLVREGD